MAVDFLLRPYMDGSEGMSEAGLRAVIRTSVDPQLGEVVQSMARYLGRDLGRAAVAATKSTDPLERRGAVTMLGVLKDRTGGRVAGVTEALTAATRDPNPDVRAAAIAALRPRAAGLAPATGPATHPSSTGPTTNRSGAGPASRRSATAPAAQLPATRPAAARSVAELIRDLKTPGPAGIAAAQALGSLGADAMQALPTLQLIAREDSPLGAAALEAAKAIEIDADHAAAPRHFSSGGVHSMADADVALRSASAEDHLAALMYLSSYSHQPPINLMSQFRTSLKDRDSRVRAEAANAVSRAGAQGSAALPELIALCDDWNVEVAINAIKAIATVAPENPQSLAVLAKSLDNSRGAIRSVAAWALGNIGLAAKPQLPRLKQMAATDPSKLAKRNALQAAAQIEQAVAGAARGEPTLIDLLNKQLKEADPEKRRTAAELLGHSGDRARSSLPAILLATNDPDVRVRAAAGWAAASIDSSDQRGSPGALGIQTLTAIVEGSGPWPEKIDAIKLLSRLGRRAAPAIPALKRAAAADKNGAVSSEVEAALRMIEPETSDAAVPGASSRPNR